MKNVLITGASRGIGRQIALDFAKNGYNVIVNYNKSIDAMKSLEDELKQLNCNYYIAKADVSSYDSCNNLVDEVIKNFGHIDVLVNNAGVCHEKLLIDETYESIDTILNINLKGTIYLTKFVIENMLKHNGGRIINISSILGSTGCSNESIYSASKGAINSFTKSLSKEYGNHNITVNAIAPGCINTDMMAGFSDNELNYLKNNISLGRIGAPSDISKVALFLASDSAQYITGQVIGVDGGFVI